MRQVVWSPIAEQELDALISYYAELDLDLPARLLDRVQQATARLLDHPRLGVALVDSDTRKWRAAGTPFLLFYRPTSDGVRITKVRDARSDWKRR